LPKQPPDLIKNLALDVVHTILGILDPEPQLEFDRGFVERHDQRVGRRHGKDPLGVACRLPHQGKSLIEIRIVRHPDRHFQPNSVALVRPVDDLVGDDVLVWNQILGAVTRLNSHIARAEGGYQPR
jgi:hypothetical protein